MIRTIFFDFDGVLTLNERGSTTTIGVIAELSPDLSVQAVERCYYQFHHDLLLGKVTHLEIRPELCRCIGRDFDSAILHEAFARTPLNQEMLRLASALAARYHVGMITDNASDRMACLVAEHRLDALFDPIVVSAHVGKLKTTRDSSSTLCDCAGTGLRNACSSTTSRRTSSCPRGLA